MYEINIHMWHTTLWSGLTFTFWPFAATFNEHKHIKRFIKNLTLNQKEVEQLNVWEQAAEQQWGWRAVWPPVVRHVFGGWDVNEMSSAARAQLTNKQLNYLDSTLKRVLKLLSSPTGCCHSVAEASDLITWSSSVAPDQTIRLSWSLF